MVAFLVFLDLVLGVVVLVVLRGELDELRRRLADLERHLARPAPEPRRTPPPPPPTPSPPPSPPPPRGHCNRRRRP